MTTLEPVDALVRGFARFLAAAWTEVIVASAFSRTGSFLRDWLQANWEMIVEGGLSPGVFLEVYGDGADCNERSSRVYRPDVMATHAVVCRPRDGKPSITDILGGERIEFGTAGLPVEELVSVEGTWYATLPPFDCVLVEQNAKSHVFRIDEVIFTLAPATRG